MTQSNKAIKERMGCTHPITRDIEACSIMNRKNLRIQGQILKALSEGHTGDTAKITLRDDETGNAIVLKYYLKVGAKGFRKPKSQPKREMSFWQGFKYLFME